MQALILAAGMGRRLGSKLNKCMIEINGISLFERFVQALRIAGVFKLTVVTGYNADALERFILAHTDGFDVRFVRNEEYETTNNIWSLYLAQEVLGSDDTILMESDLIFHQDLLKTLAETPSPNIAVVAKLERWMDGTTVLLNGLNVLRFISKEDFDPYNFAVSYKTVNIYKLSKDFLKCKYIPALKSCIEKNGKEQFYESALKKLVTLPEVNLQALILDSKWYEIDTESDWKYAADYFCDN